MRLLREIRVLDRAYPARLRELPSPPDPVCIRGHLLGGPAVAVVGTRTPTVAARDYAHALAFGLAKQGIAVWSGGALGIDAAAHRGALDGGGVTVAVVGTGLDHCYPAEHALLYDEIVDQGGAIVSPFSPAQPAMHYTFTRRNGVLVALTDAIVVVQARLKSGARSAAGFARRLGRPVFVVPSAPWEELGAGNLAELELGASVLLNQASLVAASGMHFATRAAPPKPQRPAPRPRTDDGRRVGRSHVTALARVEPEFDSLACTAVFRATSPTPRHFDDLCSETGLSASLVQQALLTLTLQAVLVEGPAGWYRRSSR